MTAAIARDPIYRCRRFQPEIIELCVRWYLTYPLSYLDLVEMLAVRGGVRYLYRAVDKFGKTVDSLLCADRSVSAARAFFFKALKTHYPRRPQKLNLDGNAASHLALRLVVQENPDLQSVMVRSSRYLNNIVEQDHRAIKRRCAPMLALKSFRTAAVTLAGVASRCPRASPLR